MSSLRYIPDGRLKMMELEVKEVRDREGRVYLPPCEVRCPVGQNIQRSNMRISLLPPDEEKALKEIIALGDEIYEKNPLFPICGYICGLCENDCNYRETTGAIRRRLLERFIGDRYLEYLEKEKAPLPEPRGERVALVGGGPSSLMCAYMLAKRGYRCTIFEARSHLGGALNFIPRYRLPRRVLEVTLKSLLRIAHIDVRMGEKIGGDGRSLDDLKREGFRAIFLAPGPPIPRPLTFGRELVPGGELEGVEFGLHLLGDVNEGKIPPDYYRGKRVIVIGGGNVAFDVARTARRLGGEVLVVCLECEDKSHKDGIPADVEEIEGATEEGIKIVYSRGVQEIIGKNGKFERIKCPRCTSVWDDFPGGRFNPQFDLSDVIYIEGDVLLITIGQMTDRTFLGEQGLLDETGRLAVDPVTLMSTKKEGVFIGGDARRIGFAAEAMRDGIIAAESIDRYLKGEDMRAGREKEYSKAPLPEVSRYKPQPKYKWKEVSERLNFEPFEEGFTLREAIEEAERCLHCGPCESCKGCVASGLQPELPKVEVRGTLCSGCGICLSSCAYSAVKFQKENGRTISFIDDVLCKRCGVCAAACPSNAITITDKMEEGISEVL
ncbi:MAG: hypothetical protein DRN29_11235, partial [Thermoplasmata archaeon]